MRARWAASSFRRARWSSKFWRSLSPKLIGLITSFVLESAQLVSGMAGTVQPGSGSHQECPSLGSTSKRRARLQYALSAGMERNPMSKKAAEHHRKASEHLKHAAHHHEEAAKHHDAGHHEKAAHHAHTARGHVIHGRGHAEEAVKAHTEEHGKK